MELKPSRKGAPFLSAFTRLASRLEDAGLVKHWSEEVMAQRVKENRGKAQPDGARMFGSQVRRKGLSELVD